MFTPNYNLVIKNLSENSTLLDICVELEDFLDSLDIGAYENWYDGVIVEGPIVERYWTSITLLYDYLKMPNPRAASKLIKYGCLVTYRKNKIEMVVEPKSNEDLIDRNGEKQMKTYFKPIWLVEIKFPKRFINSVNSQKMSVEENNMDSINQNNQQPPEDNTDKDTGIESDTNENENADDAADDIMKDLK